MNFNDKEQRIKQLWKLALDTSKHYGARQEEAEDVAQEVMLRLWQLQKEIAEGHKSKSLTVIMARNMTIDLHRKKRMMVVDKQCQDFENVGDPHKTLVERDEEEWLEQRIKNLPATQHAILRMRHIEQMTNGEIAEALGITTKSVATLLSRARKKLLEEIRRRNKQ